MRLFGAKLFTPILKSEYCLKIAAVMMKEMENTSRKFTALQGQNGEIVERGVVVAVAVFSTCLSIVCESGSHFQALNISPRFSQRTQGWFWVRAFMFISRTNHEFFTGFCAAFDRHIHGMAELLSGKSFIRGSESLPQNAEEAESTFNLNGMM